MKSKLHGKADPIERQAEPALHPGAFIRDGECLSFVSGLEKVAATIDKLIATDTACAAALYESFLAGCHAKAVEIDDSSVHPRQQRGSDLVRVGASGLPGFDPAADQTLGELPEAA
jgi:hypothetical protein